MTSPPQPDSIARWARERGQALDRGASALKWWVEAGVDTLVGETPRNWLAAAPEPVRAPEIVAEAPPPRAREIPAAPPPPAKSPPPDTLDTFLAWLADCELGFDPVGPRLMPAGDPASGLMVLVDMPSLEDVRSMRLLSGPAGELFDRMLAAIGRDRASIWLAPLAPARTATGRIDRQAAERLTALLRHHVGLVAPRALLVFGDECSRALFGAPVARTRGKWHEPSAATGKVRTLVTLNLQNLIEKPGLKKLAWDDLKMLIEEYKS